ncbi:uncharacterized protein LOC131428622 [Malaya genurostris]|uniref:uncharacterized protein LOC131428622 n=1 Tax=Malaya genurostris TaxID=325434 RepID=UPI0026F3B7A2|nr:uncharacterized protein LOC131428622 [Malaya genurostris]
MRWFTVGNVLEAARPLYLVTRAFSLMPITVNFRDQSAEQTPADQLVMIRGIFMCCSTMYFSFGAIRGQLQQMSDSYILSTGLFGTMFILVCFLLVTIISNYVNGLEIFRSATIVNKVDQQFLTYFGFRCNYQKEHQNSVILITIGYLEWTFFMVLVSAIGYTMPLDSSWYVLLARIIGSIWFNDQLPSVPHVKMRWFRADSFFESLRPVYLIAKVLLLHFETIDFERRTVRRTLFDQILYVLTLIMDLYLSLVGIRSCAAFIELSDSMLLNLGYGGSFLMSYLLSLALPLWNGLKARTIFSIYESIAAYDDDLKLLGLRIDHQRHNFVSTIFVMCSMCFAFFMLAIVSYAHFNKDWIDLSKVFLEYWMVIPFVRTALGAGIFFSYFCLTLLSLQHRFVTLNQVVMKFFQTSPEKDPLMPTDSETCCKMIRKLATLHDQLCDTIELFNRCFSIQAMFALAAAFGFTVFSIFGLIHSYATNAAENTLRLAWCNMCYDGFYLAFIFQLIVFSSLIYAECKHTAVLIHKVLCYGTYDKIVRKELRIFSQQLWHQAPKVSCSLFDFDWTLFYTIGGSLTTYLIILVQFDLVNFDYSELADQKS